MLTLVKPTHPWEPAFTATGFTSRSDGAFMRGDLQADRRGRWLIFQEQGSASAGRDPLSLLTDRMGLWKTVMDGAFQPRHELTLPAGIVGRDRDDLDNADSPAQACLDWVLATAAGQIPEGWECPPRKAVEGWIPAGGLSIQRGPFAVQGSLTCERDRWQLAFPLVHELSRSLSENRRAWLRGALVDAHNRWRLARLVQREDRGRVRITAEVDLSGAPEEAAEELFKVSLAALRWVVSSLICPVSLLADPSVKCRVWESPPEKFFP